MRITDGEDLEDEIVTLIAEKGLLMTVLVLIPYIPFCVFMIPFSMTRKVSDG